MIPRTWNTARCPSRSHPTRRALAAALILALASGCEGARSLELTGEEARRRLPAELAAIVPADAILCHDEQGHGGDYHLWIVRQPGGTWLEFPKRKGLDHHTMPTSALASILKSKLPSLDPGSPAEPRCRFTHWCADDNDVGAEFQVREIITDQGWFASLERVRM
jgi:hypothetical protein